MGIEVYETAIGDKHWETIRSTFPHAVTLQQECEDDGAVIDLGKAGFGPLADRSVGYLDDIFVHADTRRAGIGTALIRRILHSAWSQNAEHVRSNITYEDEAAIAFFDRPGFAFIPDEPPEKEDAETSYTVVTINPDRGGCA